MTSQRADVPGSSRPGPTEIPDIADEKALPTPQRRLRVFAIETAGLTAGTVPAGRDPRGYGEASADWRPFTGQRVSLAQHVRQIAERRNFKAEVSGIKSVRDPGSRRPGIILIDPWFIADEAGRSALQSAVHGLPRWVLPLAVLGPAGRFAHPGTRRPGPGYPGRRGGAAYPHGAPGRPGGQFARCVRFHHPRPGEQGRTAIPSVSSRKGSIVPGGQTTTFGLSRAAG